MSNQISFVGCLGNDPETKLVGDTTCHYFSVAENIYMGKGRDQKTQWWRISLWGEYGKAITPHLRKGQKVFVKGIAMLDRYTNKDGVEKSYLEVRKAEIEFVSSKNGSSSSESSESEPF